MKKILLFLFVAAFGLTGCQKDYKIYTAPELSRCLTPVDVKATVQYMKVTFDWRLFADATSYAVEIYSALPEEGMEPDPETLIDAFDVDKDKLPYTYVGPEDQKCYYRVKAKNPTRADSRWTAFASFKTDTDPTVSCSKPANLTATAICDMVVFDWEVFPNTKIYEVEIYDKFIPSTGEPDEATLVQKLELEPTQLPDTLMMNPDKKFFYRVRATNPDSDLKPSKWVGGSFETKTFVWPTDEKALNETITQKYTGTDDEGNPSPFTGSNTKNTQEITINGFTYGVQCTCWGNRMSLPAGNSSTVTSEFGAFVPLKNYMSFKTCKPGSIETYLTSTSGGEACVVILTDKEGEGKKAKVIFQSSDIHTDYYAKGKTQDKIVIKEGDLYGIKEAATVYVFASNHKNVQVLQMTWTPSL